MKSLMNDFVIYMVYTHNDNFNNRPKQSRILRCFLRN